MRADPRWATVTCAVALLISGRGVAKEGANCSGPVECCPAELSESLPHKVIISVGVVLIGVNDANERAGTWDADLYLYESWPVTAGFSPQTEVVNEVSRQTEDEDFDLTTLDGSRCSRTRRVRLKLHTGYNLRRFPFDHQRLELELSWILSSIRPGSATRKFLRWRGVDDRARDQLVGMDYRG